MHFVVTIKQTLPGVRSQVYVFHSESDAYEFQDALHKKFQDIETSMEQSGSPEDIFSIWWV